MKIKMTTFSDIQEFANICNSFPDHVDVCSGHYLINGKSLMGLLSLDYKQDVFVKIHDSIASEEEVQRLKEALSRFKEDV